MNMQNESQNIEYKESWRDEYLKWICGFANAQGGRIYIGVNDQKEVIGLSDAKRLLEDIPNKIVRSIELWNYGLLPKELTPAALLQKHSSYPRNHNIANVFYKAGFVESWGRGFKKIAEEFERAKLPLPMIEENGGGVMAIIQRKTIDEVIAERGGDVGVHGGDGGNVGGNETYLSSATYPFFYCKAFRHYRQANVGNVGNSSAHYRKRTIFVAKS